MCLWCQLIWEKMAWLSLYMPSVLPELTVSMSWGQAGSRSSGGVSSVCRSSAKLYRESAAVQRWHSRVKTSLCKFTRCQIWRACMLETRSISCSCGEDPLRRSGGILVTPGGASGMSNKVRASLYQQWWEQISYWQVGHCHSRILL